MAPLTIEQIMALPFLPLADRNRLPRGAGVYCVVVNRTDVVYVGMAGTSLRRRWSQHHLKDALLEMDNVTIAFAQEGDLAAIERATIYSLAPRFNIRGTAPAEEVFSISLPPDTVAEVQRIANERGLKRSQVIREAVTTWLGWQRKISRFADRVMTQ